LSRTKKKYRSGSGTFRFDWREIGVRDQNSQRAIRRAARRLAAPPDRERRDYGRAKTLTVDQLERVVDYLRKTSRVPESDVLKVYLSHYGGLRACEIAGLRWEHVTDATGRGLDKEILIPRNISKGGMGRKVPMHDKVREALLAFRLAYPSSERLAISSRRGRTQTPNAVAAWFWHMYRRVGYAGCSSHSGRRWYISQLARIANKHGCSIVDVQKMAGHARLDSTQCYIDPFTENTYAMVASLGDGFDLPTEPQALELYARTMETRRKLGRQAMPKWRGAR
jgi:integrase/recombinase XerD